jgi:hypothetical protein
MNQRRIKELRINLTATELNQLKAMAKRDHLAVSVWARRELLKAAEAAKVKPE